MQTRIRETQKGFAFECRKDKAGEFYLLETLNKYTIYGYSGLRIITALDSQGNFVIPYFLRFGIVNCVADENLNLDSLLKGHLPTVVPLKKALLLADIKPVLNQLTNTFEVKTDLYLPNQLEQSVDLFSDKRGWDAPALYCKKLQTKQVMGMNTEVINPKLYDGYKKSIENFFTQHNITDRLSFINARLGR